MSLLGPGVLTEGGPAGREDERACRRDVVLAASLCDRGSMLSDCMTASKSEDMVAVCV